MSDNQKERLQKLMIDGDVQPAVAYLEELMQADPTIINTGLNVNGATFQDISQPSALSITTFSYQPRSSLSCATLGSTCLIFANKHLELTKYLVERGADVNAANKYGKTALIYASNGGKVEV